MHVLDVVLRLRFVAHIQAVLQSSSTHVAKAADWPLGKWRSTFDAYTVCIT